ncbi:hybrid sensor histidine kinase/response regulator [Balneolaceae bacterium YR4-1]|uniref:histidine kinase n=1 Tax=Halalkalibaculum roseum TaxID=2709311 RepID=A0A6M1SN40_9BACT|nr:hybrid sensor histidine kinase/response regulator [Halalkalibaculum roseum]NGP76469.1 hybrid sensor histidine kinase/response regulator [Halalkalibaculum roseum]
MSENSKEASVLIVDDTEPNVRLLAHVVKKEGYEVMAAFSGGDALSLIEKRKPDIILLDVMMPEMNGFEVCEYLKDHEQYKDIPVIFLSALSETDSKVQGFNVGGVDYITKPFQREEVLARIDLHVKLKKLQAELSNKVEQLKQREESLEKLNAEKDELMRIVGHDFRNPVTGIMGLAGFLEDNIENIDVAEQSDILGIIKGSGQKLLNLVNGLLNKEEKASISELILQELDLKTTILDIIDLHRPTAVNKGITIEKELQEMSKKTVDKHKLEQILSNLLSNALKFTLKGGTICVRLREVEDSNGAIDLTVEDSGMGIPKEQLEDLWDSGEKKIRYGTSGEKGSGMGLELVRKFTNLHGGDVTVDSVEGEGTTFTVRLYDQKMNVASNVT